MEKKIKKEQIAFRCTTEFREKIEKEAKKQHRTLSNYIQLALLEKIERDYK